MTARLLNRPECSERNCVQPCRRKDNRPWSGEGFQVCVDEYGLVLMRGRSAKSVAVLTVEHFHHFLNHVKRGDYDLAVR